MARRAERQAPVAGIVRAVGGGVAVLALSAVTPWVHFTDRAHLGDIRHYRAIAERILDGRIPYHQFFVEYPPAALAIFLLPTAAGGSVGTYGMAFRLAAAVATIAAIVAVVFSIRRLGADATRMLAAAVFVGASPILLGSVFFERYDIWAAGLTSVAVLALLSGRYSTSAALIGLGAATKVYPVLLLPLLVLRVARRSGVRASMQAAVVAGIAFTAVVGPFAAIAPGGVGYSFKTQFTRVLEIESVGGSVLLCAHRLGMYHPTIRGGLSYELTGRLPALIGVVQTIVFVLGLATVYWAFSKSDQTLDEIALAAAAAITLTVTFDKVISPQYLVWLVPAIALLGRRIGTVAWSLLAASMILTLSYFPGRFRDLRHAGPSAWIVLGRNVVLLALAAFLVATLVGRRRRTAPA